MGKVGVVMVLVLFGLLSSACGSGSASPGVANLGSTTTTAAASASQGATTGANYTAAVAFASCMRRHGVPNFPDPTSSGDFVMRGVKSPQLDSADKACEHLLPNGGKPTAAQTQGLLAQALKLAQCMRAHGAVNFPDPQQKNGGISIAIGGTGLNQNSPEFKAASAACKQYTPGGNGLPGPGSKAAAG